MTGSDRTPSPEEVVIAQFVAELAEVQDPVPILDKFARLHPALAERFRREASLIRALDKLAPEESSLPPRLGEFQIVRQIAHGGMGEIHEAVQEPLGRRVAVKVIRRGRLTPEAQARFLREQKALAALHQTHIVPIHAAGQDGPLQYFAMQYIDGVTLHHLLMRVSEQHRLRPQERTPTLVELAQTARPDQQAGTASRTAAFARPPHDQNGLPDTAGRGTSTAAPPPPEAVPKPVTGVWKPRADHRMSRPYYESVARLMIDVAEAMQHAHREGILHRDLKPSNLMVDTSGHCWIIDFGLAAYLASKEKPDTDAAADDQPVEDLTRGARLGTPRYMAPEQCQGAELDARTDVWGLGAILYEMLALRPAFDGATHAEIQKRITSEFPIAPRRLLRGVPVDLDSVCLRAMQRQPAQRYATAQAFADDLRCWLRREPTRAFPGWPIRPLWLWFLRNKALGAALASALVAVVAIFFVWIGSLEYDNLRSQAKVQVAEAAEKEQKREALKQKLQLTLLTEHVNGWRARAWKLISDAASLRADDDHLRNQAAAALEGLDVQQMHHFEEVPASAVHFDPTGAYVLVGGAPLRDGISASGARVRHIAEKEWQQSSQAGAGPVAFLPQGTPVQLILSPKDGRELALWDVAKDRLVKELKVAEFEKQLPFAPLDSSSAALMTTSQGTLLAVVVRQASAKTLAILDVQTEKVLRSIPLAQRQLTALAFSPDGKWLATGEADGQLTLWPVPAGAPLVLPRAGANKVHALAFGSKRKKGLNATDESVPWFLAAGDAGGGVWLWDLDLVLARLLHPPSHYDVYALAFSPDGTMVASSGRVETRLWDVATGQVLLGLQATSSSDGARQDFMTGLAFSPDGRRLAVSSGYGFSRKHGAFVVWELENGAGIRTLRGLSAQIVRVQFSANEKQVAGLAVDWQVAIWDTQSGLLRWNLAVPRGVTADNGGMAFSPDGKRFAFAAGQEARCWDLDSGALLGSWALPSGSMDALAFDKSGTRLFSCRVETKDGKESPYDNDFRTFPRVVQLRELTGQGVAAPIKTFMHFNERVQTVSFAAHGALLVIAGTHNSGAGKAQCSIKVCTLPSAEEQWSKSYPSDAWLVVDPRGKALAIVRGAYTELFAVGSGLLVEALKVKHAARELSPALNFVLVHDAALTGPTLFRTDDGRPLVAFGTHATVHGFPAQFDAHGKHLIWGTYKGSVSLCELAAVQKKLSEVGMGW